MTRRTPVFLERRSYRRRRMGDAAMLLPVLGAVLLVIPLLWQSEAGGARTTDVMLYIFGVWVLLAGLARFVSRDLGRSVETPGEAPQTPQTPQTAQPASTAQAPPDQGPA